MTGSQGFLSGVIEGFYGRPWSHQDRTAYAPLLAELGLNSYLYCPKNDPYLRKCWQEHWPAAQWSQLHELAATYADAEVGFGVGLSPFALYSDYGSNQRETLKHKVQTLNDLGAPLLAILFDDMPGAIADLAARQADIIADVRTWSDCERLLVCPTYYSDDPVLEKHFGNRPDCYWEQLGAALTAGVDVFWTGPQVCSESIADTDLGAITAALGRKPVLWDNYPVNDGALRSNFLYCRPFEGRGTLNKNLLGGHFCNPMNEALLSLPALVGLAALYGHKSTPEFLLRTLGTELWNQLSGDVDEFQDQGLSGMGEEKCRQLARVYGDLPGPAAAEVAGWLRGEYTFDPACLTD